MGGEESLRQAFQLQKFGLPPRGRGRAAASRGRSSSTGITPAWAGKRRVCAACARARRDYPRVGGEEGRAFYNCSSLQGLPPRGRGRASAKFLRAEDIGITPAWAGKSILTLIPIPPRLDYPRVGGEEDDSAHALVRTFGLPPRGRGRVFTSGRHGRDSRITPAWAGKSFAVCARVCATWDYPRVGGEECDVNPGVCVLQGLPPRGRGRVIANGFDARARRITPAWAGKSVRAVDDRARRKDYPRVGGEEDCSTTTTCPCLGLPPRGRGRVRRCLGRHWWESITPAWAGKSWHVASERC